MNNTPLPACTCVIPFYNERERIAPVLDVALRVSHLAGVICVDDGSTDGGAAFIAQRYPTVTLVRLPDNRGKTAAVRAGADLVETSHVLLLDADLHGLAVAEIEAAVVVALARPEIDMVILRRIKAGVHARLSRGDVLFSGERVLKTADLRQTLTMNVTGYQVEIAVNRYMAAQAKRVVWMSSSARNTLKMRKQGAVRGLAGDVVMVKNMIDYAGFGAYLEQYLHFAREAGEQPRDWKALAENTKRPRLPGSAGQALGTLPQPLRRLRRFSR